MTQSADAPLISGKPFSAFTADEYHKHVQEMYELRQKGSKPKKPNSPAEGITLSRTKKGSISIRLNKKKRAFPYVLTSELTLLCRDMNVPPSIAVTQTELWNLFKAKDYIIANTRIEAEEIYGELKGIPF